LGAQPVPLPKYAFKMDRDPYDLETAREIAEDFEDLVDTEFYWDGNNYLINHVVVCPFNEPEKSAYLATLGTDATEATDWTGIVAFDIVIVASPEQTEQPDFILSIPEFATKKGISYQLPGDH